MQLFTSIHLRQPITSELIISHGDGFEGLPAEWEKCEQRVRDFPKAKNRATLYRWMKDGVPSKGGDYKFQLLALCGLLDVDPLAIFDYEKNGYFSNFGKLRKLLQFRTFVNEAHWESSNYVMVDADFKQVSSTPRAIHIAYRRHKTSDTMWRFYGTVISLGGKLELYNEGGDHREMPSPGQGKICFRTYFGGRPVEFRIVSLHDFDYSLKYPFNDKSVIGFEW
jgi:hypothetical protein